MSYSSSSSMFHSVWTGRFLVLVPVVIHGSLDGFELLLVALVDN